MATLLRHRQTKGAATDRLGLRDAESCSLLYPIVTSIGARAFGSVARGTARRGSDIDFLVEMEEGRSLLDHAALVLDLERLLKRPVDVVSERGLRQPLRKEVLRDAIAL